jgi:hypothetical protein
VEVAAMKIKRIGIAGAAAVILMMASSAAWAREIPTPGMTIDDVVSWLQSKGYQAQVETAADGTRHVMSLTGGVKFGVYLFDCKGDTCGSMQFSAGFTTHGKFDISRMNEWNRKKRWGRAYYDSVNDPWVEMDVDLTPGSSYELLDDELATWDTALAAFVTMYDLK